MAPVNMTALLLVAAGYIESSSYGGKFRDGTEGLPFLSLKHGKQGKYGRYWKCEDLRIYP